MRPNRSSITNALGGVTEYTNGRFGLLQQVVSPSGSRTVLGYDLFGNNTGFIDRHNNLVNVDYSFNGNELGSSYEWVDPNDPDNRKTVSHQNIYDSRGRVTESVTPFGTRTHTRYGPSGQVTEEIDENGNSTYYKYDTRDQLVETRFVDGTIQRQTYDALGRTVFKSDIYPTGATSTSGTRFIYDKVGRRIGSERLLGLVIELDEINEHVSEARFVSADEVVARTESEYDHANRLIRYRGPDQSETRYEYDKAGRQTAIINGLEQRVEFEYDKAGRRVLTRDAQLRETRYEYDNGGNLIKQIHPDDTFVRIEYNNANQKIKEIDELGRETSFEYDNSDNLVAVVLPAVADPSQGDALVNPRFEYEYDQFGNRVSLRDPLGRVTTYRYDEFGREASRTLPEGQVESSVYGARGELYRRIDFNGQVTQYLYDDAGRVVEELYFASVAEADSAAPTQWKRIVLDSSGRPQSVTTEDSFEVQERAYDGRFEKITNSIGTVEYHNDHVSRYLVSMETDNTEIRYGYDEIGRLATVELLKRGGVTLADAETTEYFYSPAGNVTSTVYSNGMSVEYVYNSRDSVTAVNHLDASGATIGEFNYTYSDVGDMLTKREITYENSITTLDVLIEYEYDALRRLTREASSVLVGVASELNFAKDYVYDLAGNRLSVATTDSGGQISLETYRYDLNDRLIASTDPGGVETTYTFDANGALIETRVGGVLVGRNSYDLRGRLSTQRQFEVGDNDESIETVVTFRYGIDSEKIGEQLEVYQDGVLIASDTRDYLNTNVNPTDLSQPLEVTDALLQTTTFVYGHTPVVEIDTGESKFLLPDALGSIRAIADAAGDIIERYGYDAFGNAIGFDAATAGTTRLYRGEEFDTYIEQYYLRARNYDPTTGRFSQQDPFAGNFDQPLSLHKYNFAHQNPVTNHDPTGLGISSALLGIAVHTVLSGHFLAAGVPVIPGITRGPVPNGHVADLAINSVVGFAEGYLDGVVLPLLLPSIPILVHQVWFAALAAVAQAVGLLRPDLIILPPTGGIFEIKPNNARQRRAGRAQLAGYVAALNTIGALLFQPPVWHQGTPLEYTTAPGLQLAVGGQVANIPIQQPGGGPDLGLILYDNRAARRLDLQVFGVTALVTALSFLHPMILVAWQRVGLAINSALEGVQQGLAAASSRAAALAAGGPAFIAALASVDGSAVPAEPLRRLYSGEIENPGAVAIIDSGLNTHHPGLKNQLLIGIDFADGDDDVRDTLGHGTHIAGIVTGPSGVIPNAPIVALKVSRDGESTADPQSVLEALEWVVNHHAQYDIRAVNLSLASATRVNRDAEDRLRGALAQLEAAGVFVSAASGNRTSVSSAITANSLFGGIDTVLTVGAVWDQDRGPQRYSSGLAEYSTGFDRLAAFSQLGPDVDLVAPGGQIIGADLADGYVAQSGTSQAAANVTGAALALQGIAEEYGTELTPSQLRSLLVGSGRIVFDGDDEDSNVEASRRYYRSLDFNAAVARLFTFIQVGSIEQTTSGNEPTGEAHSDEYDFATGKIQFVATDQSWTVIGDASATDTQLILNETVTVNTSLTRITTFDPSDKSIRFTVDASQLRSSELTAADAFEAAIISSQTGMPLFAQSTLSGTDAFLNVQHDGTVFFAAGVSVQGVSQSGDVLALDQPFVVTVDVSTITAGTEAKIYFDLLGFGEIDSQVIINDFRIVGNAPQIVSLAGQTATFEGSSTSIDVVFSDDDPNEGHRVRVAWGDGAEEIISVDPGIDAVSIPYRYGDNGRYDISVTVIDDDLEESEPALWSIDIANALPEFDLGENFQIDLGDNISLPGLFTDAGTDDTHTFAWSVTTDNGQTVPDQNNQAFEFLPQAAGTYTVSLTITDDDGGATNDSVVINVAGASAGPLEIEEIIVNDGDAQRSNIETITVVFNQGTNLADLIANGSIVDAVQLQGASQVVLTADRYQYDDESNTLTLDLTHDGFGGSRSTMLADGRFALRLDTALIESNDGTRLSDDDLVDDAIRDFEFHRMLADWDGDATIDLDDRTKFFGHYGSLAGSAAYDFNYDTDADGDIDRYDYYAWLFRFGSAL